MPSCAVLPCAVLGSIHSMLSPTCPSCSLTPTTPSPSWIQPFARPSLLSFPSFAAGDQLHTWDEHDGLASTVTATLAGGFGGFSLTHSDVGGYNGGTLWLVQVKCMHAYMKQQRRQAAFAEAPTLDPCCGEQ